MNVNTEHVPQVRTACLFTADKFRKTEDLLRRLKQRDEEDVCAGQRAALLEVSGTLPGFNEARLALVITAMDITIDELNRQCQNLMTRGAADQAALYEHKLREMYAARTHLAARPTTATTQ